MGLIATAAVFFLLGFFFAGLVKEDSDTENTSIDSTTTLADGNAYAPGYRGGTNGVKLTKPASFVADKLMESIALSYEQDKQYPSGDTEYMLKIMWEYGYNGGGGGAAMKCPRDNGLFSYVAYKNQRTGVYDSFKLYY